jgi:hypothetical protein
MVALGATKQDSGISGITPFTGNMYGMASLLCYKETEYFELNNDCDQEMEQRANRQYGLYRHK